MGGMIELKLCSVCKIGHLIPTGNTLNEFKCDNPECRMHSQNKLVDMNIDDTLNIGGDVDMEHLRDVEGE